MIVYKRNATQSCQLIEEGRRSVHVVSSVVTMIVKYRPQQSGHLRTTLSVNIHRNKFEVYNAAGE